MLVGSITLIEHLLLHEAQVVLTAYEVGVALGAEVVGVGAEACIDLGGTALLVLHAQSIYRYIGGSHSEGVAGIAECDDGDALT